MALTILEYTYSGQASFPVTFPLGILSREYVTVQINSAKDGAGDPLYYTDYNWLSNSEIVINGLSTGDLIRIVRTMPKEELVSAFTAGSDVTRVNLDNQNKQLIMIAHEIQDGRYDSSTSQVAALLAEAEAARDEALGVSDNLSTIQASYLAVGILSEQGRVYTQPETGERWLSVTGGFVVTDLTDTALMSAGFALVKEIEARAALERVGVVSARTYEIENDGTVDQDDKLDEYQAGSDDLVLDLDNFIVKAAAMPTTRDFTNGLFLVDGLWRSAMVEYQAPFAPNLVTPFGGQFQRLRKRLNSRLCQKTRVGFVSDSTGEGAGAVGQANTPDTSGLTNQGRDADNFASASTWNLYSRGVGYWFSEGEAPVLTNRTYSSVGEAVATWSKTWSIYPMGDGNASVDAYHEPALHTQDEFEYGTVGSVQAATYLKDPVLPLGRRRIVRVDNGQTGYHYDKLFGFSGERISLLHGENNLGLAVDLYVNGVLTQTIETEASVSDDSDAFDETEFSFPYVDNAELEFRYRRSTVHNPTLNQTMPFYGFKVYAEFETVNFSIAGDTILSWFRDMQTNAAGQGHLPAINETFAAAFINLTINTTGNAPIEAANGANQPQNFKPYSSTRFDEELRKGIDELSLLTDVILMTCNEAEKTVISNGGISIFSINEGTRIVRAVAEQKGCDLLDIYALYNTPAWRDKINPTEVANNAALHPTTGHEFHAWCMVAATLHHNVLPQAAAIETLTLEQGSYVPVVTNESNTDVSVIVRASNWMRVGGLVTVFGNLSVDATVAGDVDFELSLPVTEDFPSFFQVSGIVQENNPGGGGSGAILSNASNDTAAIKVAAQSTGAREYTFMLSYIVTT